MSDPFEGMQEAKANWIKFGKVGDFVKGTLLEVRDTESQFIDQKTGQKKRQKVYDLQVHVGEYHNSDTTNDEAGNKVVKIIEPAVVLNMGEYWSVSGKDSIDNQMRNVKPGHIIGFRFAEIKPSKTKGNAPQKIIKVMLGGMDPNYMGQTKADAAGGDGFGGF